MHETPTETVSATTHLVAKAHEGTPIDNYSERSGACYFCGHDGPGLSAADVISEKYFSDYPLRERPDSDHVCAACAYCMDHRSLKQGHWVATRDQFRSVSTGDLLDVLREIRDGAVDAPLAVHVSANPIRSEHAYLWTPVSDTHAPLRLSYDQQTVSLEWNVFDRLLAAVEELRWHGFRGDDIRSGEPRVRDLASVGPSRYQTIDSRIEPYRGTALLDVVWTASRSKDDQPTPPNSANDD